MIFERIMFEKSGSTVFIIKLFSIEDEHEYKIWTFL